VVVFEREELGEGVLDRQGGRVAGEDARDERIDDVVEELRPEAARDELRDGFLPVRRRAAAQGFAEHVEFGADGQ
jgi:hypothetical protein